jgi:leucyl-tRNA synthetase
MLLPYILSGGRLSEDNLGIRESRSEEHTSELQSRMRISYAVFCLKKKKVTEDIYRCNFNTAVAALMEYVNELYKVGVSNDDLIALAKLLKPFAPHLTSEMLEKLGADDEWPTWDDKHLVSDTVEIVVQVNGKLRAKLSVPAEDIEDEEKIKTLALENEKVKKFVSGEPKKVIFVKKAKLVNIVA